MNYTYLIVFVENYSLPTLTIAGLVAVLSLIYDRFFANRLPVYVKNVFPFILSIIFYYTFDMIFVLRSFCFSAGTFSAGILSGSLSIIIKASVYRLKDGKSVNVDNQALIIENLLTGLVKQDLVHVVINEIKEILNGETLDKELAIINTLTQNTNEKHDSIELKVIASIIVKAVSAVKQK